MMKWYFFETFTFFAQTITEAFKDLNIPVVTPNFAPETNAPAALKKQLDACRPDIILTTGWTSCHQKSYLQTIKDYCDRHRAFHVYWSLEDPLHTELWSKYILENAAPDYVVTHEFGFDQQYQKWGIPSSYLPLACLPAIHYKRMAAPTYVSDIAVVGNYHPSAPSFVAFRHHSLNTLLKPLLEQREYSISFYGKNWNIYTKGIKKPLSKISFRGSIPYQEVPKVYSSAKIVLGIQNTPQLLTRRTFESMGCGACLLTLDTPAVNRHFENGKHLIAVNNESETVEKTGLLLENEPMRQTIAANAQQCVHEHHTYQQRLTALSDRIASYVDAKKKNKKIFPLPNELHKEIKTSFTASIDHRNQCRTDQLFVHKENGKNLQTAYLAFPLKKDADYELTKATLKVFLSQKTEQPCTIQCYQVLSPWNAATLKSGKKPILNKTPIGSITIDRPFTLVYPWTENWYTLDITQAVKDWLRRSEGNFGLCLTMGPDSDGKACFVGQDYKGGFRRIMYSDRFFPKLECVYKKTTDKIVKKAWRAFLPMT